MAFSSYLFALSLLTVSAYGGPAQLSPTFYATTCPNLESIVRRVMTLAVNMEPRMGGSILRLFFHDCFVNHGFLEGFKGCDASILLDDVGSFVGEKNAFTNRDSMRGYEVIDAIKTHVEASCNGTVSCADILALAARDGVHLLRGQSWTVPLGRRDAKTASKEAANTQIPGPWASLSTLIAMFAAKGLSARDMTVLSGTHTIGQARCLTFLPRIYNDTNIDPTFAAMRQANCSTTRGEANLVPLDLLSPTKFDNKYFKNLIAGRGLLHSDQELFNNGSQDALVRTYSQNNTQFLSDFAAAMVRMGNISPLTGRNGEIRRNCRRVN